MPGSEKQHGFSAAHIEIATWVLIFGGLAVAGFGVFVDRQPGGAILGAAFIVGGLIAVALGIVLIVVRSRMSDEPSPKAKR